MKLEHALMNLIMIECGRRDWLIFHIQPGKYYTMVGTIVDVGIPIGWSDLIIFTNNGKTIFIECKIKPNKPTKEQIKFIDNLSNRGFVASVIYSFDEFIELIKKHNI